MLRKAVLIATFLIAAPLLGKDEKKDSRKPESVARYHTGHPVGKTRKVAEKWLAKLNPTVELKRHSISKRNGRSLEVYSLGEYQMQAVYWISGKRDAKEDVLGQLKVLAGKKWPWESDDA